MVHSVPHFLGIGEEMVVFTVVEGDASVYVGVFLVEHVDAFVDDEVDLRIGKGQSQAVAERHGEYGVAYASEANDEYVMDGFHRARIFR